VSASFYPEITYILKLFMEISNSIFTSFFLSSFLSGAAAFPFPLSLLFSFSSLFFLSALKIK
jgi:hypothetical protein